MNSMENEKLLKIDHKDPKFEILFRKGNWGAHEYELTVMMRELVLRYNTLIEYINHEGHDR